MLFHVYIEVYLPLKSVLCLHARHGATAESYLENAFTGLFYFLHWPVTIYTCAPPWALGEQKSGMMSLTSFVGASLKQQQHWNSCTWWLCSPDVIWCSSNTTSAEVMDLLGFQSTYPYQGNILETWNTLSTILSLCWRTGREASAAEARTAAKPNKCSRAIKVPCAILAAKWEGGLNRNHLWYVKPLLENCGSESH